MTNVVTMVQPKEVSPSIMEKDDEIDLLSLFGTLWRGKWWIALCALIAVLAGGYYAFQVAVPMYTARAAVALESRQETVVDIESVVTGLAGDQATINTEVEVMRSRHLAKKLVAELNLLEDPEFNASLRDTSGFSLGAIKGVVRDLILGPKEAVPEDPIAVLESTVSNVLSAISISNVRQSYVFTITAETTSARKSALIANTLADLYILDQLEVKFEATQQATDWLSDRVSDLKVQLEQAEAEVKTFESGTKLVSPEALAALNRQLKELRDRTVEAEKAAEAAGKYSAELSQAMASDDPAAMAALANDRALSRILEMIADGSGDRATFDARFEQVIARADLDQQRALAQVETLNASIVELEQQIDSQSTDLVALQQLQREAEASRLIYEYFLARLKETSVQQGIQQADSRVLSEAVIPITPSAPRKSMILALSMILGLMVGAGAVLVREMLQNTFRTAEDLEAGTGHTVLGSIPSIAVKERYKLLQYILDKPTSQAAEAVRNLRTSIMLSNVDNPPKVVMTTSSLPAEGKTTLSIMLALNMAALGKNVLLVEGDIRRRVFANYLDVKPEKGLVSVLSGEVPFKDAVQRDPRLAIDVLIGEKSKINAADLYASERFQAFLKEARAQYDLVIIDTPPVLVVPDARVIGQLVDAVVYAVKWDSTAKSQVAAGLAMFDSVGIKVTGLVLSVVDTKGMKRYGYGNYGGYGHAYSGYYEN
jgi:succinoglycan biosynthesis transport protein ExoP